MPRLNTNNMDTIKAARGSFGYSAAKIEDLGACEYTLVSIVQDVSGSVSVYKKEMEKCLAEIVRACCKSPRADNLMIRFSCFGDTLEEVHGFKLLENCNPADYMGVLKINGMTALYDAAENAIAATAGYGKDLTDNDFDVNGIVFIITDGMDNSSVYTKKSVRKSLEKLIREESLESLVTVLIGVGTKDYPDITLALQEFKKESGLTQFIELADAKAGTLAKLASFVSQSISSQSQSLGTGTGAAQPQLVF